MPFLAAIPPMIAAASGASGTILPVAAASSFPWLSAITTGGQLLSGISSRLSAAGQSEAEARVLRTQAVAKERQELEQGREVTAKGHAIAAASGIEASSGSPLAIMMDNINRAIRNATIARTGGMVEADARSAEARAARRSIPGGIIGALSSSGASKLTEWAFS